jgi:hypothetical protein
MECSPREETGEAMYLHNIIVEPAAIREEIRRIDHMWKITFDGPVQTATTRIEVWATSMSDGDVDKVDVVLFDQTGSELARREIPGY